MGNVFQYKINFFTLLIAFTLATTGCRLVDGQDPGVDSVILSSLSISTECANETFVAEGYACQPKLDVAQGVNPNQLTWELTQEHSCKWIQINSTTGQLFGTAGKTDLGNCVASMRVVSGVESPRDYSMAINVRGPRISFVSNNCPTTVAVNQSYSCDFNATTLLAGATFTWSLAADNTCPWLSINSSSGVVSGTPPLSGVGNCRLSLAVSVDNISSNSLATTLTVPQVAVTVNTGSCLTSIESGVAYSCTPTASAPVTSPQFTWSFSAANTCTWAQINGSTGQVTGTPAIYSAGTCRLDVTAQITNGSSSGQSSSTLKIATKGYTELFLVDSAGDANEKASSSVAIDGNWAVIGSPLDFNGAGSASVFQFDGTTWRKRVTFNSPTPTTIKGFGYSVAILGNSILIGAPDSTTRDYREGAIVAYEFNGTSWVQSQIIIPTFTASQVLMAFGAALDMYGSQAIAATSHFNGEAAYILQKSAQGWSIGAGLPFQAVASSNGPSRVKVALHTGLAVVSDTLGGANQAGEVRIYRESAGTWTLNGVLSGAVGSSFGASVDTFNSRILVGAPADRGFTGSVYLYEGSASSWVIAKTFKAIDETANRKFGQSVSLANAQVTIGAPAKSTAGSAYVYKLNATEWILESKLMPTIGHAVDNFGAAVGASGVHVLVGADQYNYNSVTASGGAYIFRAK